MNDAGADDCLLSENPLRPGPTGARSLLANVVQAGIPAVLGLVRRLGRIPNVGRYYLVTRYDDVREVFHADPAFGVPYQANLQVITGEEPFFLGMGDTEEYRAQLAGMNAVVLPGDMAGLGDAAEAEAEAIVAAAAGPDGGHVDVVDLSRRAAFSVIARYFGVPEPERGRLDVWSTRLFEFQFVSTGDPALRREVEIIAPAFRAHIDREIARRKASRGAERAPDAPWTPAAAPGENDVLARCLARQAAGASGYEDRAIRTALLCMVVGGPPQQPMVVPQAMEQILRRSEALAAARVAAAQGDDDRLRRIVREAMRFDPLAPGLPRVALAERTVAAGTRRRKTIPAGATVIAGFSAAMFDPARIPAPRRFDAGRRDHDYIHFGHGLHECFGREINGAMLHRMLKPLFRRPGLARAPGAAGRLRKNGAFSERLVVTFDA